MTWGQIRSQLDGVELKKTYLELNPLAPEFVPNRLRHVTYTPPEMVGFGRYGYYFRNETLPLGGVVHVPKMVTPVVGIRPVHPTLNPLQAGTAAALKTEPHPPGSAAAPVSEHLEVGLIVVP